MCTQVYLFLAVIVYVRAQVPAHKVVSLGSIVIGYQPPRSMRNVNPYAKFDSGSTQSFRTYNDVRASQTSRAMGRDGYIYGGVQVKTPNALHSYYPSNPTHTKEPTRFNYQASQMRDHFLSSHGYTVNVPKNTKPKTFAGPAVHDTYEAFIHAGQI